MAVLKLVTIEGKVAAVLPPEVLAELGVREGDSVTVAPALAQAGDEETARQVEIARRIVREHHVVLSALAR